MTKNNIRTANESFENVAKFKYLGTTLTNKDDIHDEIKTRLNSGNACYHWSLTLREEHRQSVFENRVLRRIFGPKREEDGTWRELLG
jgi:hypothetical protein